MQTPEISNLSQISNLTESGEQMNIICLIGSSRFKEYFHRLAYKLELKSNLVLMMGFFANHDNIIITPEERIILNKVDCYRIDISNEIIVMNINDYIGEDTKNELEYARSKHKKISWLYPSQHSIEGEL